ncbi:hypothetical protein NR402_18165, partial [Acidithiobacillus ferrooxidans]|uniref:hypothetical protein n=1 Tax=Acidithiobacillus ferrooxidans TaxID=920 RepID=UPI00214ADD7F
PLLTHIGTDAQHPTGSSLGRQPDKHASDYAKEMADAWAKWGKHLTNLRAQAKGIALVAGE